MSVDPRYTLFAAMAVFDARLTAMDVRVLAALGTFTDRQGWCRPSQTTIAEKIGSSRTWVNSSISRLVEHGYVQVVQQVRESGAQAVNLYRVLIDISSPEAVEAVAEAGETLELMPVSRPDTPLSAGQTPQPDVVNFQLVPQDVDPPVSRPDTPLSVHANGGVSVPADTIVNIPITKNIPKDSRRKRENAARLRDDWVPRPDEIEFGVAGGLSEDEVLAAADHMRDWATANARAKANWDLTFRNWLRTAIADAARGRRPVVSKKFDRASALRIFRAHGYRHPKLTDTDIAGATS